MSTASAIQWQKRVYRCIMPREKPDKIIVPDDVEIRLTHEPCFLCGQRDGCRHRIAA
jgi:hypothetical protein